MANPITGPIEKSDFTQWATRHRYTKSYRQARPYNLTLPYTVRGSNKERVHGAGDGRTAYDFAMRLMDVGGGWESLDTRAYSKLKFKLLDTASLGVSIAEFGQSVDMISKRASQLRWFTKLIQNWQFADAAKFLRLSAVPKRVSQKRAWANNWLEYWFGWSPLIGDIYSAAEVLSSEPPNGVRVKGSASERVQVFDKSFRTWTSSSFWVPYRSGFEYQVWDGSRRCETGATFSVSNPHLLLLNQLGLANPAVVGYELIKFSFVANWFFTLEEYLSSLTDFLGLSLSQAYTSRSVNLLSDHQYLDEQVVRTGTNPDVFTTLREHRGSAWRVKQFERAGVLAAPSVTVRKFKLPVTRALTSVSLLVQQLSKR